MRETPNIKEQLTLLASLQEIDTHIYSISKEKEEAPGKIAELQNVFDQKKAHLNSLEEKAKALITKRREKELDLKTKEEEIKKFNNQLYSLKTNKEYQAMLSQISGVKSDNSLIEEDILKIMDEQEALKKEIDEEKNRLVIEEKSFNAEKQKVQEKLKEIDYKFNELQQKRIQVLPLVNKNILAHYERILKGKDGLAIVAVKNDSCQGCFMNVTPQVINEIKMLDRIITCQACARILYIEEDI